MAAVTGHEVQTQHDLRCGCRRQPILAKYGLDKNGRLYVHVKIHKQRQVCGEILCQGGEIKILCRECLRWHRVNVVQSKRAVLEEVPVPAEVAPPPFFVQEVTDVTSDAPSVDAVSQLGTRVPAGSAVQEG